MVRWHFYAAVYEDGARTATLYIDPHLQEVPTPVLTVATGIPKPHSIFRLGGFNSDIDWPVGCLAWVGVTT